MEETNSVHFMIFIVPLILGAVFAGLFLLEKKQTGKQKSIWAHKKRKTALLLSVLGMTGAHRFYLGWLWKGYLQLLGLVSLIGGIILQNPGQRSGFARISGLSGDLTAFSWMLIAAGAIALLWVISDAARIFRGTLGPADGTAYADGGSKTRKGNGIKLNYNAPVTLTYFFVCLIALLLGWITAGASNRVLFQVHGFNFADPLSYLRLFTHIFGHSGYPHFIGNMTYLLLLGPLLEEKYGTKTMLITIALTAVITGLLACLMNVSMLGASGVVFAFIVLSSFTAFDEKHIPLTTILVILLFVGQQVEQMVTSNGNVAYFSHFAGGAVGGVIGCLLNRKKGDHER